MSLNHVKILYTLAALIVVVLGLVLYQVHQTQKALSDQVLNLPSQVSSPAVASSTDDVIIGNNPLAQFVDGTLIAVNPTQVTVKDNSGATKSITLVPNATVKLEGAIKDPVTTQKELDAYNAQVALLLKDSIKNKAALAAMQQPTPRVITRGALSDLHTGDTISVELNADGSLAVAIYKDTLQSPK